MKTLTRLSLYVLPAALAAGAACASCGSSFCSANTLWDTQGISSDEGLLIDLRYSYAKADKLRAGSSRVTPDAPSGSGEEIENMRTVNRLLNVTADYSINARWNIALTVPLVMRDHKHTFDALVPDAPMTQQAKFTEFGDARLTGKYKFDLGSMNSGAGIRFGAKLPTGEIHKNMTPRDPSDPTTPYRLERSAQPGSGSTDLILGAYYYRNLPGTGWGWFASTQMQSAIATRDHFHPGREGSVDLGMHYAVADNVNLLLQLNGQYRGRDSGTNANPASGGRSWSLAPGVSVALTPQTQVYGLAQFVVRQYVNTAANDPASAQLTAPWALTAGISHRFE